MWYYRSNQLLIVSSAENVISFDPSLSLVFIKVDSAGVSERRHTTFNEGCMKLKP